MKKATKGFTLIELVVVIVILGILAVTAAPRFLDLQSDARAATLKGLKGAMAGAAGIVYGKSAVRGFETLPFHTDPDTDIALVYGYPQASSAGIGRAVQGLQDGSGDFFELTNHASAAGSTTVVYGLSNSNASNCVVIYQTGVDKGQAPLITSPQATDC